MTGSTIRNYYKKRLSHGRSIAARAFDFIALRLLFFAAVYCLFFDGMKDRLSALILSLLALALFCIVMAFVNSLRLEHFKQSCCNPSANQSVITCPMMVKIRKIKLFRQKIQSELTHIRHQVLRNCQCINRC